MKRCKIEFKSLLGHVIEKIEIENNKRSITIYTREWKNAPRLRKYEMYHDQDCCEYVRIEEIIGDLEDLLNEPILLSEEVSRIATDEETSECGTWTFYKLSTIKGSVTFRWLGESNGYYSESVDIYEVYE